MLILLNLNYAKLFNFSIFIKFLKIVFIAQIFILYLYIRRLICFRDMANNLGLFYT